MSEPRGECRDHALAGGLLAGLFVLLRMLPVTAESFSYDYANYMSYFRAMQDTDWQTAFELLPLTFPYLLIPGGGAFELGFVALAKGLLDWFDAATTYALLAGVSVGLRTFAMRRLGLGWWWILLIQLYAITLFEANALRAGLALSITLMGLLAVLRGHRLLGLLAFVLGVSQHLQVLLFCVPFIVFSLIPTQWLRRWWLSAALAPLAFALSLVALALGSDIDSSKLDDYAGQASGAAGLNLISLISLLFVAIAMVHALMRREQHSPEAEAVHMLWLRALLASMPALSLLLFGSAMAAVGDRAWQFALVILVALSGSMASARSGRWSRNAVLGLLLSVALLNTLLRYPLSNFFAPPLPYEPISPLWLVR